MSDLWSFLARAKRAYADCARRRHPQAPPRAYAVRAARSFAGPAGAPGGLAAYTAAPAVAGATAAAARPMLEAVFGLGESGDVGQVHGPSGGSLHPDEVVTTG